MTREDVIGIFHELFRFGIVKASAAGASKSIELTVEGADGEGSAPDNELWGQAPLLFKPQDGAECAHFHLGDERVVFITKDRRWQIAVADGEVVLRAMGPGSPAYLQLKPNGEARLFSNNINLGGTATQFVALANLVIAQFNTLKAAISGAGVTPGDGGAAFKAAIMAALSAWPASVASSQTRSL